MNDLTTTNPVFTRRHILAGAAVIGAGLVAAACGSDSKDTASSTANSTGGSATDPATSTADTTGATTADSMTETTTAGGGVDLQVAALAASLEVLAVGTYKAALDAAGAGSLGDVPPAVAEFVTTAMSQHQEQLDAWNKVLSGAGVAEVTEPNATLKPVVDD